MTTELVRLGKLDQAIASGTRAVDIAGKLGDLRLRIVSASYLAHAHYYRGDYERAAELAYQNLSALPSEWLSENLGYATRTSVTDRWTLVKSLATVGKYTEAMSHAAEGIQFAEKTQHAYSIGMAYAAGGYLNLLKGEWSKARTLLDHGIEVTTAANALILLTYTVGECAWALAQLNETTEALIRVRDCEERIQQQAQEGVVATLGWAYHSVGRACLRLGQVDEAERLALQSLELSSPGYSGIEAYSQHLLGDIATHPDRFDSDAGEARYRQALALAKPRHMRPLIAHCHLGFGRLYRRTAQPREAREHLTAAVSMYREMDMSFWLQEAESQVRDLG